MLGGVHYPLVIEHAFTVSFLGWFLFYYLGLYLRNVNDTIVFNKKKLVIMYFFFAWIQIIETFSLDFVGKWNVHTQCKLSVLPVAFIFCLLSHEYIKRGEVRDSLLKKCWFLLVTIHLEFI